MAGRGAMLSRAFGSLCRIASSCRAPVSPALSLSRPMSSSYLAAAASGRSPAGTGISLPPLKDLVQPKVPPLVHRESIILGQIPGLKRWEIINPGVAGSQTPIVDPTPASQVEKHANRLIVIRKQKMKKHKRKKLAKRMAVIWARIRDNREAKKEKTFQNEMLAKVKKAEDFDAEKYVLAVLNRIHNKPRRETFEERRDRLVSRISLELLTNFLISLATSASLWQLREICQGQRIQFGGRPMWGPTVRWELVCGEVERDVSHSDIQDMRIKVRPGRPKSKPWYSRECYLAKKSAKASLTAFKETNTDVDRNIYVSNRKRYTTLINFNKKKYLQEKQELLKNARDSANFWKTIATLKDKSYTRKYNNFRVAMLLQQTALC
ncbi:hypothetical protein LAZ67_5001689 [Cordylochernes scorpioides]|uniref:Ribosomal protein mS38 C-terminal domain-containing protein n=1 Tax=Cordylochernes scorpioides TaxID=51811 RepID=A0ABY6KJD2_9ARAC|nr:hypothetical protein LAZ67_5001689 [Cordylochernes scorpioides]